MVYKIVRIDGKEDDITSQTFSNYADAYDCGRLVSSKIHEKECRGLGTHQ